MLPLSVKQLMFLCHAAHSASLIFCIAHSLPVCVRLPPFVFFPLAVSFLPFRQSLSPPPSLLLSPPPSPHAASVPLPCCCRLCFVVLYCTFCPWKSREFEIVGWKEEAWRIMDRGGEIVVHAQLQIDTALPGRWRHFLLLPLWVSRLIFFPSSFGPKRKAQGTPHMSSSRLEVFSSEAQPGRPNTFQSRHTVGGREFRGMDRTFLSKRLHSVRGYICIWHVECALAWFLFQLLRANMITRTLKFWYRSDAMAAVVLIITLLTYKTLDGCWVRGDCWKAENPRLINIW